MASKTVFKTARNSGFHDNDPLAELTRIMGLQGNDQPEASDEVDFGIDLEKELLGDLERDEPVAVASQGSAETVETRSIEGDAEIDAVFSDVFEDEAGDVTGAADVEQPAAEDGIDPSAAVSDVDAQADNSLDDDDLAAFDEAIEAIDFETAGFEQTTPENELATTAEAPEAGQEPEMSLEDELGALLGASPEAAEADDAPVAAAAAWEPADGEAADEWTPRADDEWAAVDDAPPVDDGWSAADAVSDRDGLADPRAFDTAYSPEASEDTFDADDLDDEVVRADDESLETQAFETNTAEPADHAAAQSDEAADDLDVAIVELVEDDDWAVDLPPLDAQFAGEAVEEDGHADVPAQDERDSAWLTESDDSDPEFSESLDEIDPAPEPSPQAEEARADADDNDPFAALAALAAAPSLVKPFGRGNPVAMQPSSERFVAPASAAATPSAYSPVAYQPASTPFVEQVEEASPVADDSDYAPEIDTIDISDDMAALADELDIPELVDDEPAPRAVDFDDLDAEFASAFNQLNTPVEKPAAAWGQPTPTATAATAQDDYERAYRADLARIDAAGAGFASAAAAGASSPSGHAHASHDGDDHDSPIAEFAGSGNETPAEDEDVYALDDPYAVEPFDEPARPARNRGLLVAAVVAGVAIAGGIGAFALSLGGSGDDGPALVKADTSPVKVKPETPGGVVVPTRDGKVYETAAGQRPGAPEQEKLISAAEEPIVPVAAAGPTAPPVSDSVAAAPAAPVAGGTDLPGVETPQVKSEERVIPQETAPAARQEETPIITPRKVRTMIVRPDGTLVAREEPTPAPVAAAPAGSADDASDATPMVASTQPVAPPVAAGAPDNSNYSILPDEDQVREDQVQDIVTPAPRPTPPAATKPVETAAAAEKPVAKPRAETAASESNPAEEPVVEVAGGPAAASVGADLWSVQIASQPTREGAQASYEDLARRFGSVIGGKGVNIVKADITGKGTYWRVRIPAASKSDANILCAKFKTAGGNCYVSK